MELRRAATNAISTGAPPCLHHRNCYRSSATNAIWSLTREINPLEGKFTVLAQARWTREKEGGGDAREREGAGDTAERGRGASRRGAMAASGGGHRAEEEGIERGRWDRAKKLVGNFLRTNLQN
jgi:hypothetical protein